jgi:hypothetical protein
MLHAHTRSYQGVSEFLAPYIRKTYASTATLLPYAAALLQQHRAPRLLISRSHEFYINYIDLAVRSNYSSPAARALRRPRRAQQLLVSGGTRSTSTSSCAATTRLRPHALYVDLAVRRNYSSPAARTLRRPRRALRLLVSSRTRSTPTSSCTASTRLYSPSCNDLPRLRRASGCLGTSRGSSSTTSPPPRVRVPRHVARLVVDYFASAARTGALAHRAARHAARRAAHRRLLRLCRASGCLSTSRVSSRG